MPNIKLPPGEADRRALERSKRSNAIKKAKRDAERLLGIPPDYKKLTPDKRSEATIYQRERRQRLAALKPKRIPMTAEEKRLRSIEKTRKSYEAKLAKQGKSRQIPVKKRTKEIKDKPIKPKKMEKILKQRPAKRVTDEKPKPVKHDLTKQPDVVKIKERNPDLVRVKLNEKTWVDVMPGYDIDALRRKYLRG